MDGAGIRPAPEKTDRYLRLALPDRDEEPEDFEPEEREPDELDRPDEPDRLDGAEPPDRTEAPDEEPLERGAL